MRRMTRLNVLFIVCNGALLVAEITSPCKSNNSGHNNHCSFWGLARYLTSCNNLAEPAGFPDAEPLLNTDDQLHVAPA